jgi:hypothetical protein
MSTAELGTNELSVDLLLVPDPGGPKAAVHVAAHAATSTWFLRSVVDVIVGNPLGPLSTLGTPPPCTTNADCTTKSCNQGKCALESFDATAGWVAPGSSLVLQGVLMDAVGSVAPGLAEAAFSLSSSDETVQVMPPKYKGWPTPPDCGPGVGFVSGRGVWGQASARYVVSCNLMNAPSGPNASLWIGSNDSSTTPVQVATGMTSDILMNPSSYAFVNGQHFVAFGGKPSAFSALGMGAFAYGPDAASLQKATPLTIVPNMGTIPMGLAPLPTNDGFVLFLAAIDPTLSNGSFWTGPVKTADFAGLAQTPPPTLNKVLSSTMITTLASANSAATCPQGIVAAGASLDQHSVRLSWFDADGTPLVLEMPVYTSTSSKITQAAAAPLGIATLVVWIEKWESPSAVSYAVNATKLLCTK